MHSDRDIWSCACCTPRTNLDAVRFRVRVVKQNLGIRESDALVGWGSVRRADEVGAVRNARQNRVSVEERICLINAHTETLRQVERRYSVASVWAVRSLEPDLYALLRDVYALERIGLSRVDVEPRENILRDERGHCEHFPYAAARAADGNRLLFQVVPEGKTAKNRVHLDLHVPEGERDAKVAQLLALGATKLADGRLGPETWVVLADPEGNELCVA